MQAATMHATWRQESGKGQSSRLRAAGMVPGVVYGKGKDTSLIQATTKELDKVLRLFGNSSLIALEIDGPRGPYSTGLDLKASKKRVLIKDVQRDPLAGTVQSFDLVEVAMDEKTKLSIPIVVLGEDNRHKETGAVQLFLREVSISALPGDLPHRATVDATEMLPGHTVRVSDLDLGDKVHIETPLDEVILTISHPKTEEDTSDDSNPAQATSPAVVAKGE